MNVIGRQGSAPRDLPATTRPRAGGGGQKRIASPRAQRHGGRSSRHRPTRSARRTALPPVEPARLPGRTRSRASPRTPPAPVRSRHARSCGPATSRSFSATTDQPRRRPSTTVLPERDGRSRARVVVLRQPQPGVDPGRWSQGSTDPRLPYGRSRRAAGGGPVSTRRLTVGQALVEFLGHQWTVDGETARADDPERPWHLRPRKRGRAGPGAQAIQLSDPTLLPYHQARNEQAMVHRPSALPASIVAARRSRQPPRSGPARRTCSPARRSPPPTGYPCCSCQATRSRHASPTPCFRQIEQPYDPGIQVTDAFRPLSRFFDRCSGPSSSTRSRWRRCGC